MIIDKKIIFFLICIIFPFHLIGQNPITGCYWEWMNGNISKNGVTKDLEYMKEAGIESAFIFDVWIGIPRGPIDYGSPEWIDILKFACKEAKRLGIILGLHNSPGYTAMGGPWIEPHESMKQLTWSVSSDSLPPIPPHKSGFYKDIKIFHCNTADSIFLINKRVEAGEPLIINLSGKIPINGLNIWRGEREKPLDEFDGPRDYPPSFTIESSIDSIKWEFIGKASGPMLKAHDIPTHFSWVDVEASYLKLTSNRATNIDRVEVMTGEGIGETYRRVGFTTTGKTVTAAPESAIGLEVDKLSKKGFYAHKEKFLEPLLNELHEYCGNTLKYIVIDSWEAGRQDYTEDLGEDYIINGDGKFFLRGNIGKNNSTKERLFMNEFLLPFKEFVNSYGLLLVGEPYGDGDFNAKEYGMALDIPMSEYWARSHYGTIQRPITVSEYAREAGKTIIGCESFTAYPGDADIPATLESFKEDIDKLIEAGVNYFILHCITHQYDDNYPLTMGPFGTRFDRLHADVNKVKEITDYIKTRVINQ